MIIAVLSFLSSASSALFSTSPRELRAPEKKFAEVLPETAAHPHKFQRSDKSKPLGFYQTLGQNERRGILN